MEAYKFYNMRKLLILCGVFFFNTLSAQHIYKNRKLFGGSFYINSQALRDITFDGNTVNSNGDDYWNNTPYIKDVYKDTKINSRMRFDMRYGWFPVDQLAIGGDFDITSNSYTDEDANDDSTFIRSTYMQNKSRDFTIGPFIRWYMFEVGSQPYEIGAFFLEGGYKFGTGSSTDKFQFTTNNTLIYDEKETYVYIMTKATAKLGFSMYLSDFISHNWFTGFLLGLEPSIQYDWITRNDLAEDISGNLEKRKQISTGLKFNIALIAYF